MITVTFDRAKITIDSYGDIKTKKEYKIRKEQFNNLIKSLEKNAIRELTLGGIEDCTGGTTERISYSDKEKEVFSAYVYHSAGVDSGNLDGNVKNFATDIQKLIPDLHTLLTKY